MTKPKFTYVLGAGASAFKNSDCKQVLPTMENLPDRVIELYQLLSHRDFNVDSSAFKTLFKDFSWLNQESYGHLSVDILARKFYLRNELENLKRLKSVLSTFFAIEQIMRGIDPRYDMFFATLLTGKHDKIGFPDNIKIISWNYDNQIELSLRQFYSAFEPETIDIDSNHSDSQEILGKNVIKLNGSATLYKGEHESFNYRLPFPENHKFELSMKETNELIRNFIDLHCNLRNHRGPNIFFAWEEMENNSKVQEAKELIYDTNYLVYIGYSFPTFNREIDKELIKAMNPKKLQKVFIQAPEERFPELRQKFSALSNDYPEHLIEPIFNKNEFYIPFEF